MPEEALQTQEMGGRRRGKLFPVLTHVTRSQLDMVAVYATSQSNYANIIRRAHITGYLDQIE